MGDLHLTCPPKSLKNSENKHLIEPPDESGPISKMPAEILEEIFVLCTSWNYGYQKPKNYLAWSQVCRAWRQVSVDSGRLWQHISLSDPRLAAECLIRSKQAPLYITSNSSANTIPKDLAIHAGRLQSIDVTLVPSEMVHLFASIGQDLPTLKDLSLRVLPMTSTVFLDLSVPSIRRLSLEGVAIRWDQCEDLTYLSLRGADQAFFPSLSQLHRILNSSPNIEHVVLESFLPPSGYDEELPPISLSHLKKFVISSYPHVIRSILSSVHISSQTRLSLYVSEYQDFRSLLPVSPTTTGPIQTSLFRTMDTDTIRLSRHGVFFIQSNSPAWNDDFSNFLLSVSSASAIGMHIRDSLNYVVDLSMIKHLELNVGALVGVSENELKSLFRDLANLESLRMAFNDIDNLFHVLQSIDESTGLLFLPRLTELSLGKVGDMWWHFGEKWTEPIVQTMKIRRERSCTIRTLNLQCCNGLTPEMIADLKGVVQRIVLQQRV